jgi:8-oxo-dGTP pyrophosphatase MutT (NUDIX family)
MQLVKCRTLFNETKLVPADSLIQRPSVYGLIFNQHQILVARASHTQKFVLPGGGIEKGEDIKAALKREVIEETGVEVEVGEFLHFETDFFYYDPADLAIHGFLFFYHCMPLTTQLGTPTHAVEEGLDCPLWADINSLTPASFQAHGKITLDLVSRLIKTG